MIDRLRSLPVPATIALSAAGVALPLAVAVIALAQTRWVPVLDLVMTEFRVSDVGTGETPLIGLPGRIGDLPEQGSHPGPLSFWLLAPGYRLFGSSAWALEASTAVLAFGWISLAVWIGHRRLGRAGLAMVAAVVAVSIRGFGLSVLTQPWNPYMPLLAWLVVLLATWSVFCGDHRMLLPLVGAASFAAQTHIPYLTMAGSLGLAAVAMVAVRWWRTRSDAEQAQRVPRTIVLTVGAFIALWVGPLADQLRRDPGNMRRLIDHFSAPSEDTIGLSGGIRLTLRHLDVIGAFLGQLTGSERFLREGFDPDGTLIPGALVLMCWVIAAVAARRIGHRDLVRLHSTVALALAIGVISMSRIFGQRWFYLTLWAWVTATLLLVATAWTAVAVARVRSSDSTFTSTWLSQRSLTTAAAATAAMGTVAMVIVAPSTEHPEQYLGETVAELLGPTEAALDVQASYVVEWKDAQHFGAQAFGLLAELRRDGYDVTAGEFWRVPATAQRTTPVGAADTAIVFVNGGFVDQWRADDRFTEVALADPRSDAERTEFEVLRAELLVELEAAGLDDLIAEVDLNLFGLNIDQRISERVREISARMIRLGQPTAVFLGPPGTAL